MYQIHFPDSENVAFTACGDGGIIRMPENEQEALIIYIRQGTAEIAYKTLKQTAYAGDVIAAAAQVQITFSVDAVYDWMAFSHERLSLLPAASVLTPGQDGITLGSLFSCVRPAQLDFLFKYMIDTNETEMLARQKRTHMARLILCEISGQYFYPQTGRHNLRFLEILEWLQSHYTEAFSLDEISMRFQYNKVYLCRLFRDKTGETMYAYVTRLRMEKAMTLLADSTDTIKEIAREVGYPDEKQFIRNFRLYNKMTATQYRLQCVGKPFERVKVNR
jgi:YesN/AraC family two-component response regulator